MDELAGIDNNLENMYVEIIHHISDYQIDMKDESFLSIFR
jgi:hypothetical protein